MTSSSGRWGCEPKKRTFARTKYRSKILKSLEGGCCCAFRGVKEERGKCQSPADEGRRRADCELRSVSCCEAFFSAERWRMP